jgi:hypothetical protein
MTTTAAGAPAPVGTRVQNAIFQRSVRGQSGGRLAINVAP